ncbi:MAG: HEPN domain-containing protein [Thermodesulfobacteriota bacterium]|jgi:HEPN domain-containing protein
MADAKGQLVRGWLSKALRDLAAAQRLAEGPEPFFDTAVYHCQQAAEKAVKAYLTWRDRRFDKTHDVRLLMALAASLEPRLKVWLDAADRLTPYAIAFRYPGDVMEPSAEDYGDAVAAADGICRAILEVLPLTLHP